ncbi:MAG: cation transporter [Candidatus Omnitrophica bacterium CG02_land_8_20_14_3_00__42_8]|nr:MAG: cation transporter [Candidatus Omnitrophica bacterium CG02_land_8_20_14_3_00__42_8]
MDKFREIKRILIITLFFNWLVAFSKLIYGLITKSAAMTADGVHSFADGASNIIGLVGIWAASKPIDEDHPYGHKKYETIATLGISVMLFLASFDIIKGSFLRLFHPVVPDVNAFSFSLMAVAFLINIIVMRYEYKKGRQLSSDVLVCDSIHTKSDMFVSSAVIVTLISTKLGLPIIDTVVAFIIGVLIAKTGFDILKKSSDVLCDGEAVEKAKIARVVSGVFGVKAIHKIRTRGREDDVHVDLHVAVNTSMHVDAAHELSHRISDTLKEKIPGITDVIVHIEPSQYK